MPAYNSTLTHAYSRSRRRVGKLFFAVGSLLAAGLAGGVVYAALQNVPVPLPIPMTQIVAAAHDLPMGATITAQDLKRVSLLQEGPPPSYLSTEELALGRVTKGPIAEGEPINDRQLAPRNAGHGLSALIPAGMRAQALRVNEESGVSGFLHPGDYVDVITILRDADGLESKTSLQNIRVLAIGDQYQSDAAHDGEAQRASVVTALVTPEQAQILALALTNGRIALTLRNGYDAEEVSTPGFSGSGLSVAPPEAVTPEQPAPTNATTPGKPTKHTPAPASLPSQPTLSGETTSQMPQLIIGHKVINGSTGKVILVPQLKDEPH